MNACTCFHSKDEKCILVDSVSERDRVVGESRQGHLTDEASDQ